MQDGILIFNSVIGTALILFALALLRESVAEQEARAVRIALLGMLFLLGLLCLSFFETRVRITVALFYGLSCLFGFICLIPGRKNPRALQGAMGYITGEVKKFDENFVVFARCSSLPQYEKAYNTFYSENPHLREPDEIRRRKGLLGELGRIDGCYRPNVAMIRSLFGMEHYLQPYHRADPDPEQPVADLDPVKTTAIVKGFARHLGAVAVGISEVNPAWVYSRRSRIHDGKWENWGKEIKVPRYAVVMLTEMQHSTMMGAPHTPIIVESSANYARGSYISTIVAKWCSQMGYTGIAENDSHYDVILPPLAADAGLGEVGRLGYLIAPRFGARVRIFATLTDMPLIPDKPISIGVEEFCRKCMKCADSCPSRSIPHGEMEDIGGTRRWKLDEDSCFEYWARIGTDCGICMAICPFSRPNSYFHKGIRWCVANSPIAKATFPHIDNFIYGKRWKRRKVPDWLRFPKRS